MATAGTSGLGRKKKAPGLMDQIGKFFGGDKKKRGKYPRFIPWSPVFLTPKTSAFLIPTPWRCEPCPPFLQELCKCINHMLI
ncbi:hypothetical protein QTP86_018459 [Hemibagrus guttatus]|nr:hypothetical protein QTP86_018459 [Hemibagrus guttatus]